MKIMRLANFAAAAVSILALSSIVRAQEPKAAAMAAPAAVAETAKAFTLVSVLIDDVKFWLPGTIVVDQGDKVQLTLKNQVPGPDVTHGFTIPGYKIAEVVTRGSPKTVTFVADKPGVFPFFCQLHAAHVGGQLIVRAKP